MIIILYSEFCEVLTTFNLHASAENENNYIVYDNNDHKVALIPKDQMGPFLVYTKVPGFVATQLSHFSNTPLNERHGNKVTLTMTHATYRALTCNNWAEKLSAISMPTEITMSSNQRKAWNKIQSEISDKYKESTKASLESLSNLMTESEESSKNAPKDDKLEDKQSNN